MSGEGYPASNPEAEDNAQGDEKMKQPVDQQEQDYDPNHEINVKLRDIQSETVARMRDEFGDAAKQFELGAGWEGWNDVLAAPDIIEAFREKYGQYVAERAARLRAGYNDSADHDTRLAA